MPCVKNDHQTVSLRDPRRWPATIKSGMKEEHDKSCPAASANSDRPSQTQLILGRSPEKADKQRDKLATPSTIDRSGAKVMSNFCKPGIISWTAPGR